MKRLCEFEDLDAVGLIAKLLLPIGRLVQNDGVKEARRAAQEEGRTMPMVELAGLMLEHGAQDIMTMLALLNETDPAEYHCNAVTVLHDVLTMFGDPDLQALFVSQSKTLASSGSASASTEAPTAPPASSDTAEPGSGGRPRKKSGGAT